MTAPDAAIAVGYGDRPSPRQLRLIGWQPVRKPPLYGFACVELPIGLRIFDVPIRAGKNGLWTGLPAKPEIDRDGRGSISAVVPMADAVKAGWAAAPSAQDVLPQLLALALRPRVGALVDRDGELR